MKFTYVKVVTVVLCLLLLIFAYITAWEKKTVVYTEYMQSKAKEKDNFRKALEEELDQLTNSYAVNSEEIVDWAKRNVTIDMDSITYEKEYTNQEMDVMAMSIYIDRYWDDAQEWNPTRYDQEVGMFVLLYGNLPKNTEFQELLKEREMLYYMIEQLKLTLQELE